MRKRKVTVVLGKKLRAIRLWKGITQTEMLQMVLPDGIDEQRARVSQWEKGTRQPPIKAQIIYAQIGGIPLEDLLNDERKLPAHLLVIHPRFSKKKNKQNEAKKGTSEKSNRRSNRAKDTGNAHKKIVDPRSENDALITDDKSKAKVPENESDSTAQNNSDGIASTESWRHYKEELLELPVNIENDQLTEPITLHLPNKTLDTLEDMQLELQLTVPRIYRRHLTLSGIANFSLKIVLEDYRKRGAQSLIVAQTGLLLEQLNGLSDKPANE